MTIDKAKAVKQAKDEGELDPRYFGEPVSGWPLWARARYGNDNDDLGHVRVGVVVEPLRVEDVE